PTELDRYYSLSKTTIVCRNKSMYGQWFIENGADPVHLKYVHMAPTIPNRDEYRWDGPYWRSWEEGPRRSTGTQGMSIVINRGHPTQIPLGDYDYSEQVNIVAVTEVGPCVTDVFVITYLVKEAGYPEEIGPRALRAWNARN